MLASLLYVQRKGMKPFGFIPFLLLCKFGGMKMNEYRKIVLPLLQEKLLLCRKVQNKQLHIQSKHLIFVKLSVNQIQK